MILALPLDGLLKGDNSLNLPILLLYVLDRHVPERHLHDVSNNPCLIVLLMIEVKMTYLIMYLGARFKDESSAVLVSEGQ